MAESVPITSVIVGTAGHIDHGKSSLVQKLTGIDPDRLQEEKERGMTIDLGFARYRSASGKLVGIIDVPGHERFIKNMVAGATSVDIVILVVAADDGVMPQTREHLEILALLGLAEGFTVVTKADLVDEELLELAVDDVQGFLVGTFLEGQPILTCSNTTGAGMEAIRAELDRRIEAAVPRRAEGLFRMPIQRVFSAKGHGTVVTGVPLSGTIAVGEELEILPLGKTGRVRGIQAYGTVRDEARAGHSTALNLSDLDYREVVRGMVAATPTFFRASNLFDARVRFLPSATEPLEHRTQVKVHLGTAEVMARLRILDRERLLPGEEGLAQLELEEPVVASPGDTFLIRRPSPMVTLGGGQLVGSSPHHRRRLKSFHVDAVGGRAKALEDPRAAAVLSAEQRRFAPFSSHDLAVDLSFDLHRVQELVAEIAKLGNLVPIRGDTYLSKQFASLGRKRILQVLGELHKAHPLKKLIEIRDVRSRAELPETVFKALLAITIRDGAVCEDGAPGQLRLASHKPALAEGDEQLLDELRATFATAECMPPSAAQTSKKLEADERHVGRLMDLLCDEGELVRIGPHYFHRASLERARSELVKNARGNNGEVEIPALRDTLSTSRKFMIPLLEYFDGSGITVRRGDKRFLRESQVG